MALTKGRELHKIAEKYLMNDPDWSYGIMPPLYSNFRALKAILDRKVASVHAVEYPLYSERLKTAGSVDLVATWGGYAEDQTGGEMTVVDFKTSKRPKQEKHILSYFVQATTYALMFEEMYKCPRIEDIVVIIIIDQQMIQAFHKQAKDYYNIVEAIFPMREMR